MRELKGQSTSVRGDNNQRILTGEVLCLSFDLSSRSNPQNTLTLSLNTLKFSPEAFHLSKTSFNEGRDACESQRKQWREGLSVKTQINFL